MSAFCNSPRLRRSRRQTRRERGSTLVVTVVLVAVLTVAAAGLVLRSRMGAEAAGASRRQDAVLSCAESARELLLSQFHAFNVNIADLQLDRTTGGHRMGSGHYDTFNVKSVEPLAGKGVIAENAVMGLANRSIQVGLGGAPYRMTVLCSDSSGKGQQAEVEYLVRFGL